MGAKGSKLSKPADYEENHLRFESWNDLLGKCPGCEYNSVSITIIKNVGRADRIIPYYDYESKYFNFRCPKCQCNWHSKLLG